MEKTTEGTSLYCKFDYLYKKNKAKIQKDAQGKINKNQINNNKKGEMHTEISDNSHMVKFHTPKLLLKQSKALCGQCHKGTASTIRKSNKETAG